MPLRRGVRRRFDTGISLALVDAKVPFESRYRPSGSHGDGDYVLFEYIVDGVHGKSGGTCFLAVTQADASGPVGIGRFLGRTPVGHEGAGLGSHWSNRSYRFLVKFSAVHA